jgi:hypothetical protein
MDMLVLQERIAKVQGTRELLIGLKRYPNREVLSRDIERALVEMDDLMAEFRRAFPNGVLADSIEPD